MTALCIFFSLLSFPIILIRCSELEESISSVLTRVEPLVLRCKLAHSTSFLTSLSEVILLPHIGHLLIHSTIPNREKRTSRWEFCRLHLPSFCKLSLPSACRALFSCPQLSRPYTAYPLLTLWPHPLEMTPCLHVYSSLGLSQPRIPHCLPLSLIGFLQFYLFIYLLIYLHNPGWSPWESGVGRNRVCM